MQIKVSEVVQPPYQLFDDLDQATYSELKKSITDNGVLVPVEYDDQGNILDGHHRVKICQELGITKWPSVVRINMTEQEKKLHVIALNVARRHLTTESKQKAISRALIEAPEKSNRQIARMIGVDHKTVASARGELESCGEIPHVSTVTDTMGRQQPARRPISTTAESMDKALAKSEKIAAAIEKMPDLAAPLATGELKATEALRMVRKEEARISAQDLPAGKYRVIYADPPWQYNDARQTNDHRESTGADYHYATMPHEEICSLPIKEMAATDSVLFLWATFPLLPDALEVVSSWGFTYKTAFIWDKGTGAFGHYHNAAAELLLVATRGNCTPDSDKREEQVKRYDRLGHSVKPPGWRFMIDRLYHHGPRIELFCRGMASDGWETWGAEACQQRT